MAMNFIAKKLYGNKKCNKTSITKANKGGAVVILDVKDYIKEAEKQLNNPENYKNFKKTQQQQT